MEIILYIIMGLVVLFIIGITIWVMIRNKQSDEQYERELDRIYGRKR